MSAVLATALTVATIAALAAIAEERIRRYRLEHTGLDVRPIAIAVIVTLVRGWLALRGLTGIDTSVVLAIAAVAAMTDLRCGYVFDRMLLAGGTLLIAVEAAQGRAATALAGGAVGASAMGVPWALSRGRSMGLGDVKLAGVLGCALGPYGTLRALWFAFVIGTLIAIAGMVTRRLKRAQTLPFAPFLALGALLSTGSAAW